MSVAIFVAGVVGFWCLIFAFHYFLSLKFQGFRNWIRENNIQITFLNILWFTPRLNDALYRRINSESVQNAYRKWFFIGRVFGVVLMFAGTMVMLLNILVHIVIFLTSISKTNENTENMSNNTPSSRPIPLLTPVMPGINLPISHLVYFFITLIVNGVLHELGHAVAAICEGVSIKSFGIFVYILYPGAFVALDTDQLEAIPRSRQLGIYTGGVFHNVLIGGVAGLLLLLTPHILYLGYISGTGATVVDVMEGSPVFSTLKRGVVINELNNGYCSVSSVSDLNDCFSHLSPYMRQNNPKLRKEPLPEFGYCTTVLKISQDAVNKQGITSLFTNDTNFQDLCCNGAPSTPSHLCFSVISESEFACLPARKTVTGSRCESDNECTSFDDDDDSQPVCVKPQIPTGIQLVKIHYKDESDDNFVLYWGDPIILLESVKTTNYYPRHALIPLSFPQYFETILRYFLSLSLALGLVNSVPCFKLDGEHILRSLIERNDRPDRAATADTILYFGAFLIICNLLISLYSAII